ncbi:NAD(P)-dependent oxidoreductase [Caldovatus aquaticus]|uniref:NAD(P)-dependent oxidoreductase n=1 Tax=Caldovatus aquaticus TaxID=2865671 RepID=A0ABS7F4E6_9PROT|nr:NAD(P)-dependent oxidoreductase [Caldovatus aquaticus]
MTRPRLGFLGIGLMGEAMVRRLRERGWPVTAWNLEPERLALVVPCGAVAAPSPAAVVAASDIVLSCVLHAEAVANCLFGPQGVASAGPAACAGKLHIDLSTIEPAAARDFAERLRREAGMRFVDAPVSGGPPGARAGTLTIMAGGAPEDFAAAEPVLRELGANVTHMGPVGAGQTAKVINQAIVGTGFVLMAEALALAEAAGIDAAALPACLAGGFADSALLQKIYPRMQARAFDPPIGYARQLLKDMKAVQAFAHGLGLTLPVVEQALARFADYVAQGNAMADAVSVVRLYRPDPSR